MYFRLFGMVKKVVGQSHTLNHQINSSLRYIILLLNEDVEARDIPGYMTTSDSIWRRLYFQGKVFYCGRCYSNIPSTKAVCLNREMRSSNLQQNKTKIGNSRISLKLTQSHIRMQKPIPKGARWSKMMLLRDNKLCRRVVQLSNNQTQWYKGKRCGRPAKQLLPSKEGNSYCLSSNTHRKPKT